MFGKSVEVITLKVEVASLRNEVALRKKDGETLMAENDSLRLQLKKNDLVNELRDREKGIAIEEARNEIRKRMRESLVTSDLARAEAEAKLEAYEKMNTKDQSNQIMAMLKDAIRGLGESKTTIVK